MPKVSVIIPAYNAGRWLTPALESVCQRQAIRDLEVVVVDDGSTDNTAEMARAFDNRVRVISQQKSGRSGARNAGIGEARGDYVAFLDADDLYHPAKLETQLDYLDARPSIAGVLTSLGRFGVDATPANDPWTDDQVRGFSSADFLVRDVGHPASLLARRDAVKDVRFPVGVHAVEDRIFLALVREHGPLGFISAPLYLYRTHDRPHFSSQHLRWHRFESLRRWLREAPAATGIAPAEAEAVALRMLADELDADYFARRVSTFGEERSRLRSLWGNVTDHPVFHRRVWPTWMFRWKDAVDGWRQMRLSVRRSS